jgi:hypothetical protein
MIGFSWSGTLRGWLVGGQFSFALNVSCDIPSRRVPTSWIVPFLLHIAQQRNLDLQLSDNGILEHVAHPPFSICVSSFHSIARQQIRCMATEKQSKYFLDKSCSS